MSPSYVNSPIPWIGGWTVDSPGILRELNSRPVPAIATLPQIRYTNGVSNTYYVNGAAHVMDTSQNPGAGRVYEFGELSGPTGTHDIEEGMYDKYGLPTIIEGWWNMDGIRQVGAAGGNCFVGFEIGTIGSDTPFPSAPSNLGVIQVRFDRVLNDLVLYAAPGDGVTAGTTARMNYSGGWYNTELNISHRIRLEFAFGQYARLYAWDLNSNILRNAQITTPSAFNTSFKYNNGFGFILCTGTVASSGLQFSASNFWIHNMQPNWYQ